MAAIIVTSIISGFNLLSYLIFLSSCINELINLIIPA